MQDILQKIVPAFTEDMIVYIEKFGIKIKQELDYGLLKDIYKNNYRYNIYDYLKKTKNKISIIYTFSSINEKIFGNEIKEKIENKYLKYNLNNKSLKEIILYQVNSINILDKEIVDFISESEKNLCIIRLRKEELDKLENVINLIQSKKSEKLFIILIHLSRTISKNDKLNNNNLQNEINVNSKCISFLSPINQIFIDNINNDNNSFIDIIEAKNEDIIFKIFHPKELYKKFEICFRNFSYKIFGDKQYNIQDYINNIINQIKIDNELIDLIKIAIQSLCKNDQNYLITIFTENLIKENDIDFMDTLREYLDTKIEEYIIKLIYIFDENQVFTCLISNKDFYKSQIIKQYLYDFIQNLNNNNFEIIKLDGININNKKEQDIFLGIRIPFIKNILLNNIFRCIEINIYKEYIQYELSLMRNNDIKINIELTKKFENIIINEINNQQMIKDILKSNDDKLILDLFHDALYVYLLKHNIDTNNFENLIQLLIILIKLKLKPLIYKTNDIQEIYFEPDLVKFIRKNCVKNEERNHLLSEEEDEDNIDINEIRLKNDFFDFTNIFGKILNFIEGYSKYILYILIIYNSINGKDNNFIKAMEDYISEGEIIMDDDRNNDNLKELKCCFFIIIESLLKSLRLKKYLLIYAKIQIYIPDIVKMEKIFLLFSKEIFILEIIYKIFSFRSSKQINDEQRRQLINNIINQPKLINEDINKASKNIVDIKNLLENIYGNSEEITQLLNDIILNQYKIVGDTNFRENIIRNILLKQKNYENINLYQFLNVLVEAPESLTVIKILGKNCIDNMKNLDNYKLEFIEKNPKLILFYCETIIEKYFQDIKNKEENNNRIKYQNLLENDSFNYLKKCFGFINSKIQKNKLIELYSIAYIKRYIINYIDILFSENIKNISKSEQINDRLFNNKTIKLFILKLFLCKLNYDLKKLNFSNIKNYTDKNIKYITHLDKYLEDLLIEKESFIQYYYSYPCLEKESSFKEKISKNLPKIPYINEKNDENKKFEEKEYKEYLNYIKENNLIIDNEDIYKLYNLLSKHKYKYDILYTYLSYLLPKLNLNDNNEDFCIKNIKKIFDSFAIKDKLSQDIEMKYLINNKNKFNIILEKIKKEKGEINMTYIEIIFYVYRFYYNILVSKNIDNFYYLLATKFSDKIKSNYIPGITFGDLEDTILKLKNIFSKNPKSIFYICSCGNIYPFNSTNQVIGCSICRLEKSKKYNIFNYNYYGLVFSNEKEEKNFFIKNIEKKIQSIILKNLEYKSFELKKKKEDFLKKYFDDIPYIRYRLLNFILYGFIFYLNTFAIININDINNISVDSMTCFEIIENDWKLLDKELKIKGIPNVHMFLDNIFHNILSEMISRKINSEKDLNNFEQKIEEIIKLEINSKKTSEKYLENRNKYLDIKPNEQLVIITEEYLYNKEYENLKVDYEYLEHFTNLELPSITDFKYKFEYFTKNKSKYPIINAILDKDSHIKYLKYLPILNELCNYMIEYCSYKFTRDQANTTKIESEIEDKNELINKFIEIYGELRPFVNYYDSYIFEGQLMSLKNVENTLSNFCIDNNEFGYGMIIASIYLQMIEWQNNFIEDIKLSGNKIYEQFKEQFDNNDSMIQKCNPNEIIILPTKDELMKDYILKNATSKHFGIVDYNYRLIEEELSENILPKIKKFNSEKNKCLKFVVYQYENLQGTNNNIIIIFNEKFKREKLSKDEIELIRLYLNTNIKNEKKILDFWFTLPILIDIILENDYSEQELISKIINDNKNNVKLINSLNELFDIKNNHKKLFKVNSLMSVFYIFEFYCWKYIKQNLQSKYLDDIDINIKNNIITNFENNKFNIITKNKFLKAIRRYISRYLYSKRSSKIALENTKLIDCLKKLELWDNINDENKIEFNKELIKIFGENLITVGQALKLYESFNEKEDIKEEVKVEDSMLKQITDSIFNIVENLWNKKELIWKKKGKDRINKINFDEPKRNSIYSNSDELNNSFSEKINKSYEENSSEGRDSVNSAEEDNSRNTVDSRAEKDNSRFSHDSRFEEDNSRDSNGSRNDDETNSRNNKDSNNNSEDTD